MVGNINGQTGYMGETDSGALLRKYCFRGGETEAVPTAGTIVFGIYGQREICSQEDYAGRVPE